ncbi:MAG TPA: CPBP family intramembrane glutamic endopeptidase [Terriglobales bacterium]|nr:CPBP family intramembrane glutamic endopeptidase [Terriglobales bacterium]
MAQDDPQLTQSSSPALSAFIAEMERFPVWTLVDVGKIAIIAFVAIIFSGVLVIMIATGLPWFRGLPMDQIVSDARLATASQLLAYLITFWFVYRLIVRHYGVPFAEGVRWRWPRGSWPVYALGGLVLCLATQALEHVLPQPKHIPLTELFRNPLAAWLLTIFGIFIGPPAEELFFRGLLFPALFRKMNLSWSVLLTALPFALLHAAQLAFGWGPLLGILFVGVVLTLVRAKSDSLAGSLLVHMAYNAATFALVIYATHGFQHLEKIRG